MRVLIFTSQFFKLSGIERLALELAVDLNKRGVHADLLSMYSDDLPGVAAARERLLAAGVPSVAFLGLKVNPSFASVAAAVLRLRRLLIDGAYDVVETSSATPTLIAALACAGSSVRHLAGLHDVYTREHYRGAKNAIWRAILRGAPRTRFYAISDITRRAWLDFSGSDPARTRVIYNGIAEEWYRAPRDRSGLCKEIGAEESARLLLFVGRLMKRKGIDTLLEAVGPRLADWNAHLLYVGEPDSPSEWLDPGEGRLVPDLQQRIRREGWQSRIHFLGRRADVPRIMASSDVLVHPARIEGFGLVLAEALAAGIPVVASRVHGIPEVLAHTHSLLVPPDDPLQLREAVQRVLNRSAEDASTASEVGRARAEHFRTRRRTDEMAALFGDAMAWRNSR